MKPIACNVHIVTKSERDARVFTGRGTLDFGADCFTARYPVEQDDVTLSYSDGALSMDRRGKSCFSAKFCAGKQTPLELIEGDSRGYLPIHTSALVCTVHPGKIACSLAYRLGEGDFSASFRLKIQIIFSEEK